MKKNIFVIFSILLITCIGMNVFLLLQYKAITSKYSNIEKELSEVNSKKSHLDIVYHNKNIEAITEYFPLLESLILLDKSGESYRLPEVLSEKNKLIFYFSETHCFDCVKEAFNQIMNIPDSIKWRNYIILSNYKNTRHFKVFLNEYKLDIPIYNLNGQILNLPVEKKESPFFFVLNSDMRCKQVFIPIKEIKGYTANYLQLMNRKYWPTSNN